MAKAVVLIVVGATLGAVVVSVLLRGDRADAVSNATIIAASAVSSSNAPESTMSTDREIGNSSAYIAYIAQVSEISDPAARRVAALELLDTFGNGSASIEDIAAALPDAEAVNFRIAAIIELGRRDTEAAMAAAMALPEPEQRRLALIRLARVLAERDPLGAFEQLDTVEDLEFDFLSDLLDSWSMIDPDTVLGFLDGSNSVEIPLTEFTFELLAAQDPERLLEIADRFEPEIRTTAESAAFRSLIEQDPIAALPRIRELKPGFERSALEQEVATVFGEQDPEAAWLWANDGQMSADTKLLVLTGIQRADPNRALELLTSELTSSNAEIRAETRQRIGSYLYYLSGSATSDDVEIALDRILQLDNSVAANLQQFVGSSWASRDPEAALEWVLQNPGSVDPSQMLTNLGANLARSDSERARQMYFELSEEYRVPWVTGVGRSLAEHNLIDARAWAFEIPRGPMRDAALNEYLRAEAHGGSVDLQIFDQFSDEIVRGLAASRVALGLSCDSHTALAGQIALEQIANAELRAQTEERIERYARLGPESVPCVIGR